MVEYTFLMAGVAVSLIVVCRFLFRSPAKKKLHVQYKEMMSDTLSKLMFAVVPEFLIKRMVLQKLASQRRPLDIYQTSGEDPYTIIEVKKDKVWMIKYVNGVGSFNDLKNFLGVGDDQSSYERLIANAKTVGLEEQAEKDFEFWKQLLAVDKKTGENGEWNRLTAGSTLKMTVVKLKSGDLLLYCPVPIYEDTSLGKWLKGLGTVRYLVIGACSHNFFLPEVIKKYPDALVIGPYQSELKLLYVEALPRKKLDYQIMNPIALKTLNDLLEHEGVTIYHTSGDVASQCTFVVAYDDVAMETDLDYGHHKACLCDFCLDEKVKSGKAYTFLRIFNLMLLTKPHYLPPYRFALMDPTSRMSKTACPSPANDGSSCKIMASSLREYLKFNYKFVISTHAGIIAGEDFKKTIDMNWSWLDGNSLMN